MPSAERKGFVDYVLWGDDGNRWVWWKRSAPSVMPASANASEAVCRLFGSSSARAPSSSLQRLRPWLWDDTATAAPSAGFKKPNPTAGAAAKTRRDIGGTAINDAIVERLPDPRHPPHFGAFEKGAAESLGRHGDRRRQDTHGHRCDLLMRFNWVKRCCSSQTGLPSSTEAVNAFRAPAGFVPVNLVTEKRGSDFVACPR